MAVRTSVADGDWTNPATWDTGVPVDGDSFVIAALTTVTYDDDQSAFVTGMVGGTVTGTLQLETATGSYYLKMAANLTVTGSLLGGTDSIPVPIDAITTITFTGAFGITGAGTVELYGAAVQDDVIHLSALEGIGETILSVDTNVSASTGWNANALIRICNINGAQNHELRTFSSATPTEITITVGLTASKVAGTYIILLSRNIIIQGTAGVSRNLNGLTNATLSNCDIRIGLNGIVSCTTCTFIDCAISQQTVCVSANTSCIFTNCTISGGASGISGNTNGVFTDCISAGNGNNAIGNINSDFVGFELAGGNFGVNADSNCSFFDGIIIGNTSGIINAVSSDFNQINILNNTNGIFNSPCVYINCLIDENQRGTVFNTGAVYTSCIFSNNSIGDITRERNGTFYNCSLMSIPQNSDYNNPVWVSEWNYSESLDDSQVIGNFLSWVMGGITSKNAAILDSPRGVDSYNTVLESATYLGFWQQSVVVPAGQKLNITAYLRKDASMAFLPRVLVFAAGHDPLITGESPAITQIMTDSVDTWESYPLTLTNSSSVPQEYIIRFEGMNATGNMYSDLAFSYSVVNNQNGRAGCRRCN